MTSNEPQQPQPASEADVVGHYLPVAKYVARGVHELYPALTELDDLVQEASIGLLTAARTFDPSRGVKFSTFAFECCWYACMASFATQRQRWAAGRRMLSIDGSQRQIRDPRPASDPMADAQDLDRRRQTAAQFLDELDDRQRDVLLSRLAGEGLIEIAGRYGLTRERVRQIEQGIFSWIAGEQRTPSANGWRKEQSLRKRAREAAAAGDVGGESKNHKAERVAGVR